MEELEAPSTQRIANYLAKNKKNLKNMKVDRLIFQIRYLNERA